MKNTFFLILFLSSFISTENYFFCEDGYFTKLTGQTKSAQQAFFKNKTSDWVLSKILIFQIKNFTYLPKNEYLKCSDLTLMFVLLKRSFFTIQKTPIEHE